MIRNERQGQPTADDRDEKRVAFFGGSFDPPHLGHLEVARAARAAFRLDSVLFAPVGSQPLKPEGAMASFDDRVEMTKLAIRGEPGFTLSLADAPNASGKPNFTLETLMGLRRGLGASSTLYCLMGADSFLGLRQWHRAAEIPFVAPLIVASRPGEPPGELIDGLQAALPDGLRLESRRSWTESGVEVEEFVVVNSATGQHAPFFVMPGLDIEISASAIREQIHTAQGGETESPQSVPEAVAGYIRSHGLYR